MNDSETARRIAYNVIRAAGVNPDDYLDCLYTVARGITIMRENGWKRPEEKRGDIILFASMFAASMVALAIMLLIHNTDITLFEDLSYRLIVFGKIFTGCLPGGFCS